MKLDESQSETFHTERGVRQGCILSPKLLNLYGEYIMRKALDGWNGGVTVGGTKIMNLRYADDTTILAASETEMAAILERIERVSLEFGLHINRSKTKVMTVDRAQVLSPSNALKDYEKVEEFIYLGSLISNSGNCEKEIGRRIGMAKSAMTSLDKIWKDRNIRRVTKMRLVRTLVFSIFLYGVETWCLRKKERKKIEAFEMYCWRKLLRIPWTAMRTNVSILEELKVTKRLLTMCQERIRSFFGHIMRSSLHSLEKLTILGQMEGKRARGRAPARWVDQLKEVTGGQIWGAVHMAQNRTEWRRLTVE